MNKEVLYNLSKDGESYKINLNLDFLKFLTKPVIMANCIAEIKADPDQNLYQTLNLFQH